MRKRFTFMDRVWSTTPEAYAYIVYAIEETGCVPDLDRLAGVRMLKRRPYSYDEKIEPDHRRSGTV